MSDNLDSKGRAQLRAALAAVHPWLTHDEFGPATVDAGECDRCDQEPRMVETCGPVEWRRLGRICAAAVGADAWCDGHQEEAEAALAWLTTLPQDADDAARLWWVGTGEVKLTSLAALASRCLPAAEVRELGL